MERTCPVNPNMAVHGRPEQAGLACRGEGGPFFPSVFTIPPLHSRESEDSEQAPASGLDAREFVSRCVHAHVRGEKKRERFISLGMELYR